MSEKQKTSVKMFKKKSVKIHGAVADGFESVKDAFETGFIRGEELSAQVCVMVKGEVVVDLWASCDNPRYTGDSLQCVWSCSKNLSSLAMAVLVERNLVSYQDKISQHWPQFCSADDDLKSELSVADVMRHEAGLQVLGETLNIEDCYPENIATNNIGAVIERQTVQYLEPEHRYPSV